MLVLEVEAPFAAFRPFVTGSFRPTAPFITHSAAYGLVLNLAGIEMRADDDSSVATAVRRDLPFVAIAVGKVGGGAFNRETVQTIYQQIHNYPVGQSGIERKSGAKGSKYNIVPARRALLSDIRAYIAVRADEDVESAIRDGVSGKHELRYGVPFLGDNNFFLDRLEFVADSERQPVFWYERVTADTDVTFGEHVARFTITIDRNDMSRTKSALFRPTPAAQIDIPDAAWTTIDYSESSP